MKYLFSRRGLIYLKSREYGVVSIGRVQVAFHQLDVDPLANLKYLKFLPKTFESTFEAFFLPPVEQQFDRTMFDVLKQNKDNILFIIWYLL